MSTPEVNRTHPVMLRALAKHRQSKGQEMSLEWIKKKAIQATHHQVTFTCPECKDTGWLPIPRNSRGYESVIRCPNWKDQNRHFGQAATNWRDRFLTKAPEEDPPAKEPEPLRHEVTPSLF